MNFLTQTKVALRSLRVVASSLLFLGLLTNCRVQNTETQNASSLARICLSSTASSPASQSQVLTGKQYFDSTGALQTGSMSNLGAWNIATAFSGPGYVSSVSNLPASHMNRDLSTAQATLAAEKSGSLPTGYRDIPKILLDDEGLRDSTDPACVSNCSVVQKAARPTISCGTTQTTIQARIDHCATQNSSANSWDASKSVNGEATWKLVTYTGAKEVWVDTRTGLLWSDILADTNWCKASGNSGLSENDPSDICDNATHQNQTTPESWCAEGTGLDTPNTYDAAKGGMRLTATSTSPAMRWRLPNRNDWMQADLNGIRFVLPGIATYHWSATVLSSDRSKAIFFNSLGYGEFDWESRSNANYVRCVGRAAWE